MNKIVLISVSLVLALVAGLAGCIAPPAKTVTITTTVTVTSTLEAAVTRLEGELADTKAELAQLKATKEINFGNGLKVFDIEKAYYEVRGKVQNVSSEPMQKVVVVVAFYNKDGQLDEDWGSVGTCSLRDLFPGEVLEWEVHFGNWTDEDVGLFDVYAIGNKR